MASFVVINNPLSQTRALYMNMSVASCNGLAVTSLEESACLSPLQPSSCIVRSSRVGATPYFMLGFDVCSTMSCLEVSVSQLSSSSPSFHSSLCSLSCDAVWALKRRSHYSWSSTAEQSQLLSLARWPILSFCVNHSPLQKEASLTKFGSNYTMRINI